MKGLITRISTLFALGILVVFGSGCESMIMGAKKEPENVVGLRITSEQLRVRAMVNPLTGVLIEAANEIIAATDDPAIQREALIWKVDAVPILRESLYNPSPVAAFLDVWL